MMKNNFFLPTLVFLAVLSSSSFAEIKKGQWEYVKDPDYCLIQSAPLKTDIPEGKSRGENYLLVYRMKNNVEPIIQITAGFNYKSPDSINVKIDDKDYSFYSDADTAWAKEDKNAIMAMKKGSELITSGISDKGTEVIDTYTLIGFTAAFKKLMNDC
jgi:invasion protein IalB